MDEQEKREKANKRKSVNRLADNVYKRIAEITIQIESIFEKAQKSISNTKGAGYNAIKRKAKQPINEIAPDVLALKNISIIDFDNIDEVVEAIERLKDGLDKISASKDLGLINKEIGKAASEQSEKVLSVNTGNTNDLYSKAVELQSKMNDFVALYGQPAPRKKKQKTESNSLQNNQHLTLFSSQISAPQFSVSNINHTGDVPPELPFENAETAVLQEADTVGEIEGQSLAERESQESVLSEAVPNADVPKQEDLEKTALSDDEMLVMLAGAGIQASTEVEVAEDVESTQPEVGDISPELPFDNAETTALQDIAMESLTDDEMLAILAGTDMQVGTESSSVAGNENISESVASDLFADIQSVVAQSELALSNSQNVLNAFLKKGGSSVTERESVAAKTMIDVIKTMRKKIAGVGGVQNLSTLSNVEKVLSRINVARPYLEQYINNPAITNASQNLERQGSEGLAQDVVSNINSSFANSTDEKQDTIYSRLLDLQSKMINEKKNKGVSSSSSVAGNENISESVASDLFADIQSVVARTETLFKRTNPVLARAALGFVDTGYSAGVSEKIYNLAEIARHNVSKIKEYESITPANIDDVMKRVSAAQYNLERYAENDIVSDVDSRLQKNNQGTLSLSDLKHDSSVLKGGKNSVFARLKKLRMLYEKEGAILPVYNSASIGRYKGEDVEGNELQDKQDSKIKIDLRDVIRRLIRSIFALIAAIGGLGKAYAASLMNKYEENKQSGGYFSKDPAKSLQSNTHRDVEVVRYGERNLGKATPIRVDDLLSTAGTLASERQQVMSGQKSLNDTYAINLERILRFSPDLQKKYSLKQLLTDSSVSSYDFAKDLANSFERNLPRIKALQGQDANLIINAYRGVMPDSLLDDLVNFVQQKQTTGETRTAVEVVEDAGIKNEGNSFLTVEQDATKKALADLNAAFNDLTTALNRKYAPMFEEFFRNLSRLVRWTESKTTESVQTKTIKSNAQDEELIRTGVSRVLLSSQFKEDLNKYESESGINKTGEDKKQYEESREKIFGKEGWKKFEQKQGESLESYAERISPDAKQTDVYKQAEEVISRAASGESVGIFSLLSAFDKKDFAHYTNGSALEYEGAVLQSILSAGLNRDNFNLDTSDNNRILNPVREAVGKAVVLFAQDANNNVYDKSANPSDVFKTWKDEWEKEKIREGEYKKGRFYNSELKKEFVKDFADRFGVNEEDIQGADVWNYGTAIRYVEQDVVKQQEIWKNPIDYMRNWLVKNAESETLADNFKNISNYDVFRFFVERNANVMGEGVSDFSSFIANHTSLGKMFLEGNSYDYQGEKDFEEYLNKVFTSDLIEWAQKNNRLEDLYEIFTNLSPGHEGAMLDLSGGKIIDYKKDERGKVMYNVEKGRDGTAVITITAKGADITPSNTLTVENLNN